MQWKEGFDEKNCFVFTAVRYDGGERESNDES